MICYRHLFDYGIPIITNRVIEADNAIAFVRPSVRPSVCFHYVLNRLTFDLDFFAHAWIKTSAHLGLKAKVIGQSQR